MLLYAVLKQLIYHASFRILIHRGRGGANTDWLNYNWKIWIDKIIVLNNYRGRQILGINQIIGARNQD